MRVGILQRCNLTDVGKRSFFKQKMTIKIAADVPSLVFLLTLTLVTVSPSLLQAAVSTVHWDVNRPVGHMVRQIIACECP